MCLTPAAVKSKSGEYKSVPCGHCAECCNNLRESWFIRLREHKKAYKETSFITLTYDDEHLPWGLRPSLYRRDVQLFFKRLRKSLGTKKISYYCIGEYGTHTRRPHYHVILFGLSPEDKDLLQKSWTFGFTHIGRITDRSINYCCKYHVLRGAYPPGTEPSFSLVSKGIGINYVDKMKDYHREASHMRTFYWLDQYKKPLPRYFKQKIFNKYQLEDIAERARVIYEEKMLKESVNEHKKHYWINKQYQIEEKNRNFKRKSAENGVI